MKKIIILSFFFISNLFADNAVHKAIMRQEFDRVKTEAAQQYNERAQHKAVLLKSDQAREYLAAQKDWFDNSCAHNTSVTCQNISQKLQKALALLQKTETYNQHYAPVLKAYYVNEKKYEILGLMVSISVQPEQLNPAINSIKDQMLYAIDSMKIEDNPESSKLWLEFSCDRGALHKQAQQELRDFVENNIK